MIRECGLVMHGDWLSVAHHRIHVMELWPDGPRKENGLAVARLSLATLLKSMPEGFAFACITCTTMRQAGGDSSGTFG